MQINKSQLAEQLCEVIEDSNNMADEVMNHLDIVLNKVDELRDSKDIDNDIDGIKNNLLTIMSFLQAQDAHRQKIERVVNVMDPENGKFAASAKHITGDKSDNLVDDDEIAALVAQMAGDVK